jgi:pyruvate dehydrogenase E1 component alpha subunit
MMVVAVGLAMAFRMRGEQRCALSFFGDGATSRGDWHEAMNWAAVDRLPVIFVLENNQLAYSTPTELQYAVDPLKRAEGYGIAATAVDGNDVEAVFAAVSEARRRALAGDGPSLIEAVTMRMHGHGAHDDARYVPREQLEAWLERDPITTYARALSESGIDIEALGAEVEMEIEAAVTAALATPMADPAHATSGVFCAGEPEPLGSGHAPWSGFAEST